MVKTFSLLKEFKVNVGGSREEDRHIHNHSFCDTKCTNYGYTEKRFLKYRGLTGKDTVGRVTYLLPTK